MAEILDRQVVRHTRCQCTSTGANRHDKTSLSTLRDTESRFECMAAEQAGSPK